VRRFVLEVAAGGWGDAAVVGRRTMQRECEAHALVNIEMLPIDFECPCWLVEGF
jgi:hypothetical protein